MMNGTWLMVLSLGALGCVACSGTVDQSSGLVAVGGQSSAGSAGKAGAASMGTSGSAAGSSGGSSGGASAGSGGAVDVPVPTDRTEIASCVESPSTNAAGINVVIYGDASAERTVGPPGNLPSPVPESFPAGTPAVLTFLADLKAVGDVSKIPITRCAKSVSFGTTTTITAYGKTSGDVQCADMPTAAEAALISDCNQLLGD